MKITSDPAGGSSTVHIYTQTVQQYSTHIHTDSTAVQYTFTHRQYTVQQYSTHLHTDSTQNDTINNSCLKNFLGLEPRVVKLKLMMN